MAFLRAPSIETPADDMSSAGSRSPSPRTPRDDHDGTDGLLHSSLPEGSSLFREVMAELHPPSPSPSDPSSPNTRRRRRSSQVKHVHYVDQTSGRTHRGPSPRSKIAGDKGLQGKEVETGSEEEPQTAGPERQILHGKCHCYFVENGNVTGLADHQCQHEHRLSPLSSPRPSRKMPPTSATPSMSSSSSTPEGSPTSRRKHHHHVHNNNNNNNNSPSSLHPPSLLLPEGISRGRSHSDVSSAAGSRRRSVNSASSRTSLSPSPTPTTTNHGRRVGTASLNSSPHRGAGGAGGGGGGSSERLSSGVSDSRRERCRSARPAGPDELSDRVLKSLHVSSPPPILIQDTSEPGEGGGGGGAGGERGMSAQRRRSTHAVDSDQLHYLYDQLLPTSSFSSLGH